MQFDLGAKKMTLSDPDWDFFLPDEETYPELGDFWFEPDEDE